MMNTKMQVKRSLVCCDIEYTYLVGLKVSVTLPDREPWG